ncbi:MAG: hypothetical protein JWO69_1215, partial [Thermoleophilia bacterium]|nr:hypothetical protein [Thermoleophilia bacterium]
MRQSRAVSLIHTPAYTSLARTPVRGRADGARDLDPRLRADLLELARRSTERAWHLDGDIATARNAHRTNTLAQLRSALRSNATWLEADVRLRDGVPVLAHGAHEGWSLGLQSWLEVGAASGRGLKLDVKQASAIAPMLAMVRAAGIPQERLIINVTGAER